MKRKGFTLIELLIVIAIIALLMSILMPALAKARALAVRLVCGTNLKGIGNAMVVYAHEFEDAFPKAGGPGREWTFGGKIQRLRGRDIDDAFRSGGATMSSSLWLLVRFAKSTPKQFVCQGDDGTKAFKISEEFKVKTVYSIWDFGGDRYTMPGDHVSYSYHMPYDYDGDPGFPITDQSKSGSPVCADRNPYLDKNADDGQTNSAAHQNKGQNVLFKDAHVEFANSHTIGLREDNIWTYGGDPDFGGGTPDGTPPDRPGDGGPMGPGDAYLVNEWQTTG